MRSSIIIALLLAARVVSAQPDTHSCAVVIVRAPDDVREIIEEWVNDVPRCGGALMVRVVPTDDAFYLFVQDEQGRVRERVVPDAQSIGALIASWIADDVPTQLAPSSAIEAVGPGAQLAPSRAIEVVGPIIGPGSVSKWLSLGGVLGVVDDGFLGAHYSRGARLEVDLLSQSSWSLGVAGSMTYGMSGNGWVSDSVQTLDTRLLGYLATSARRDDWTLRAAIGAGFVNTQLKEAMTYAQHPTEAQALSPIAEASLVIAHDLGGRWGISAGPIITMFSPRRFWLTTPSWGNIESGARPDTDFMMFAAVRRRM